MHYFCRAADRQKTVMSQISSRHIQLQVHSIELVLSKTSKHDSAILFISQVERKVLGSSFSRTAQIRTVVATPQFIRPRYKSEPNTSKFSKPWYLTDTVFSKYVENVSSQTHPKISKFLYSGEHNQQSPRHKPVAAGGGGAPSPHHHLLQ
jgi:hypothetical protein